MAGTADLDLRMPLLADEPEAMAAHLELASDDFEFLLINDGESWTGYLARVEREHKGVNLAPGRVPATMYFAFVGGDLVGRVHIRHELTPGLLLTGGHIGYGVRPAYRYRGYASEMLRQSLAVLSDKGVTRALVTCDDDNVGSIRTIEACGGVLDNVVYLAGSAKRRYWIDLV